MHLINKQKNRWTREKVHAHFQTQSQRTMNKIWCICSISLLGGCSSFEKIYILGNVGSFDWRIFSKKKKTFSNIFSIFSILNVRAKLSILDVFRSPGYASGYQKWKILQSCTVYVNFKKNYFSDLYQFLFRDISFKEFLFLKSQFSIYNRAKTR